MLVPLRARRPPPTSTDTMFTPGAEICGKVFEKQATSSSARAAAKLVLAYPTVFDPTNPGSEQNATSNHQSQASASGWPEYGPATAPIPCCQSFVKHGITC